MHNTSEIRRPRQIAGRFEVLKSGRGKHRVRVLQFTTYDGHVGHSANWSHDEAYAAAVANRAAAQIAALPPPDKAKPAPAAPLLAIGQIIHRHGFTPTTKPARNRITRTTKPCMPSPDSSTA